MDSPTFLIKSREVEARLNCKKSKRAEMQLDGLITLPIRRSSNDAVWPSSEIESIARATVAGWSNDQIRALVKKLHAARATLIDGLAA